LTTGIAPQYIVSKAGKWINWPVETAFDKDRPTRLFIDASFASEPNEIVLSFMPASFTRL
jgi:hypothetical protein